MRLDTSIGLQVQSASLKDMTGAQLLKTVALPGNFAFIEQQGYVVVLPAGYLYLFFRPETVMALRWSFSPNWEEEQARMLQTVSASMESYPSLRATMYGTWFEALQTFLATS